MAFSRTRGDESKSTRKGTYQVEYDPIGRNKPRSGIKRNVPNREEPRSRKAVDARVWNIIKEIGKLMGQKKVHQAHALIQTHWADLMGWLNDSQMNSKRGHPIRNIVRDFCNTVNQAWPFLQLLKETGKHQDLQSLSTMGMNEGIAKRAAELLDTVPPQHKASSSKAPQHEQMSRFGARLAFNHQ